MTITIGTSFINNEARPIKIAPTMNNKAATMIIVIKNIILNTSIQQVQAKKLLFLPDSC